MKYVTGLLSVVSSWLVLTVVGLFNENVDRFFFFSVSCARQPLRVLFFTWLCSVPGDFLFIFSPADCF